MIRDTTRPIAIPRELRAMAARSVEQAKLSFSNYTQAAEEAVSTFEQWVDANQANAQNIRKKAMRFAERNVFSAFDFVQELVRAKDINELIGLQSEFLQLQVQVLGEQVKELGEAATVSVMEGAKGLGESATKAAVKNVKDLGEATAKAGIVLENVQDLGEVAEAA
jgi:phasin